MVLWTVAIATVIQLAMALLIVLYQRESLSTHFDARLRSRATAIATSLRDQPFHLNNGRAQSVLDERARFMLNDHVVAAIYTEDGKIVASVGSPAPPLSTVRRHISKPEEPALFRGSIKDLDTRDDHSDVRALCWKLTTDDGTSYYLVCVSNDAEFESMMMLEYRLFAFAIPIGVAIAGVAGWLIGGLAIAPLASLRRLAGSLLDEFDANTDTQKPFPTEIAALEDDLRDVRIRLRDALLVQDRFISNVSHELKTPISVLLTEAQTVDVESLPPDGQRFVQSVTDEMRRLGRMIHSFLTLTRLRGGNTLENPRECSINDIVMEAVTGCGAMAGQYKVKLVTHLAEGDPPIVSGESELLRVMVDNLIRNAIRFSPENREVQIKVIAADGTCATLIRDFGPGVPEDLLDKVFHRFVQAPSESSRGRGHGLGLSIAQGIAELHGGAINVRNSPSVGCEFSIRLPLRITEPKQPVASSH